jgi:anti-anti-sigma regulatory factor
VVLGGVGFNATNDKLILDTDITLSGNITATPTAISERVNSALLVDCTSVAEFKSTAFGALVSIVKNTELLLAKPQVLLQLRMWQRWWKPSN